MNLKQLEKDAKRLATEIRKQASVNSVAKAIRIADALTAITPVDTSKATSNWQVSAGFPKTRELEPYVPGKGGDTAPASISMAQKAARAALAKKKVGQEIYITNNTKYIKRLNEGHARNLAPGWIELTAGMAARADLSESQYKDLYPVVL